MSIVKNKNKYRFITMCILH